MEDQGGEGEVQGVDDPKNKTKTNIVCEAKCLVVTMLCSTEIFKFKWTTRNRSIIFR
jgi:hypothetical protein